jgi:hypothetical protein
MRENCTSGSEGGGAGTNRLFLPLLTVGIFGNDYNRNPVYIAIVITCMRIFAMTAFGYYL